MRSIQGFINPGTLPGIFTSKGFMIIQTFIYSEHQLWYLNLSENICISWAFMYKYVNTINISQP